jgi:hypothetical protein
MGSGTWGAEHGERNMGSGTWGAELACFRSLDRGCADVYWSQLSKIPSDSTSWIQMCVCVCGGGWVSPRGVYSIRNMRKRTMKIADERQKTMTNDLDRNR